MTESTPNPKNKEIEIDEEIIQEVIKSVNEGTHVDQKVTLYSPFATKLLVAIEETVPQAGKCTVAGWLLENAFPKTRYEKIWNRVAKDIPETTRYRSDDIGKRIHKHPLGPDKEQLLKDIEKRIKEKEVSPYITVHSPRLVASMKYLEQTVPKFKKGSVAAKLLENEAIVHLGDPNNLDILF